MNKINSYNERIKRSYLVFLKEAKQLSEQTLDAVAKALDRFESYNKHKDFKAFHYEQAVAFKHHLAKEKNQRTGELLSKATLHTTLVELRKFFEWLYGQPGFKSKFSYSDASYFNLSLKETQIGTARREQPTPTLEQIRQVIKAMPFNSEIQRRNRALIAFTLLTGMRDSAIASIKLKHIDLIANNINQDAREVKTKFSKTFYTSFFPVGQDIRAIVAEWVIYLREDLLWGNNDPIFPATRCALGVARQFEAVGLERKHWSTATPIRKIFYDAFVDTGLPYFNPHSFRNTLVQLGLDICKTPEDFKAWSQNLGHEKVLTTFLSYGEVAYSRQAEIMKGLMISNPSEDAEVKVLMKALINKLNDSEILE